MIITLDWNAFHSRFLREGLIYVEEKEDSWVFYSKDAPFVIMSEVYKKEDDSENMMFAERYLGNQNIVKVIRVEINSQLPELAPTESEDDSAVMEEAEEIDDGIIGVTSFDENHYHEFRTDENGYGNTTKIYPMDFEEHIHEVEEFKVMESNEHIHMIDMMDLPESVSEEMIMQNLTEEEDGQQ